MVQDNTARGMRLRPTSRRYFLGACLAAGAARIGASAQTRFARASGKDIVAPDGNKLQLRGINLGNWFEPEGYMFLFKDGPQSPREIEGFLNQLIGPDAAASFWKDYRNRYITEADIQFIKSCGLNSVRIPLHYKFFSPRRRRFRNSRFRYRMVPARGTMGYFGYALRARRSNRNQHRRQLELSLALQQ
jgi:hypothetical protein